MIWWKDWWIMFFLMIILVIKLKMVWEKRKCFVTFDRIMFVLNKTWISLSKRKQNMIVSCFVYCWLNFVRFLTLHFRKIQTFNALDGAQVEETWDKKRGEQEKNRVFYILMNEVIITKPLVKQKLLIHHYTSFSPVWYLKK